MNKQEAQAAGEKLLAQVDKFCTDGKLKLVRFSSGSYSYEIWMCSNTVKMFLSQMDGFVVRQVVYGKSKNWHFETGRTPAIAFKKYRNTITKQTDAYTKLWRNIINATIGE